MKNIFEINIQEPYFSHIKNGKKIVEGRLNKGKFLEIKIGDVVVVNETLSLEITGKENYKNFHEMIASEGMSNVIPDAKNIEDAVATYYQFYSKEDEEKYGVVALKFKKID